jgi:hypothetical protein
MHAVYVSSYKLTRGTTLIILLYDYRLCKISKEKSEAARRCKKGNHRRG